MADVTTREAIYAAILANPADDLPRLAFADYIEETADGQHDTDRARFIRAQIEYAQLPARCDKEADLLTEGLTDKAFFRRRCRCRVCTLQRTAYYSARRWINWDWGFEPFGCPVVWRRGWPDEARCTLVEFVGGECPACDGVGQPYTITGQCWRCKGVGRLPGLARRLGGVPLSTVTITDVEPEAIEGRSGQTEHWGWNYTGRRSHVTDNTYLPHDLFRLLVGGDYQDDPDERYAWRWFPTREFALAALSRAAVAYTRRASPA